MANVDRPNGFRPVKTLSGRPLVDMIRTIGVTDGADLFVGDMLEIASGLAIVTDGTALAACLGVAVGFGKVDADGIPLGMYNMDALGTNYYDDSASTHTDWVVYYVPANDAVFEAQTQADLDLAVGDLCDILSTAGSTVTGKSLQEIETTTSGDLICVELPHYPDNDNALIHAVVWVAVPQANQALI